MTTPLTPEKCDTPTSKENVEFADLISALPRNRGLVAKNVFQYQGFWYPDYVVPQILSFQKHFKPFSTNVLLATYPKSGTTWLTALIFAIENRTTYDYDTHPLLKTNPHDCVPRLELPPIKNYENSNLDVPILTTHLPYTALPESIVQSDCRIVYIFREPKDVVISLWHYASKLRIQSKQPPLSLEEVFEEFCNGISPFGPSWSHVLGYWKASLERPEKVLVLKYEDMKENPMDKVKQLAEFLCHPFSLEEDKQGVAEKIISLCSFENLSNLEVNKSGGSSRGRPFVVQNNSFFRKGKTGDWQNYMTKEMAERLDDIIAKNLEGSGLTLHVLSK